MARPKKEINVAIDLSVPAAIAQTALGDKFGLLQGVAKASAELVRLRRTLLDNLTGSVPEALASGLAMERGISNSVRFDVDLSGYLVLKIDRSVAVSPPPPVESATAPVEVQADSLTTVTPCYEVSEPVLGSSIPIRTDIPVTTKTPRVKGNFPTVGELRQMAQKVGVSLDGFAPQNKKGMLAAIQAAQNISQNGVATQTNAPDTSTISV